MGYSAKAIANFFIDHYKKQKFTPLKLQKLIYIAHGWHLAMYDEDLVNDEYAEAWQFGPVFPSVYHEFKDLGSQPVRRRATDLDLDEDGNVTFAAPLVKPNDERTTALLRRVWDVYGKFTAAQLIELTHAPGSPWDKAQRKDGGLRRNPHIEREDIESHYKALYEKNVRS